MDDNTADISQAVKQAAKISAGGQTYKKTGAGKKNRSGKKSGGIKKLAITGAVVVAVVLCFSFLGIYVQGLETVFPHVSVDGIPVGGLSAVEAAETLENAGFEGNEKESVIVDLPLDWVIEITAEEAGMSLSASDAAVAAFDYGRSGNIVSDLLSYLRCIITQKDIPSSSYFSIDEEYVYDRISQATQKVNLELMEANATVGGDYISVIKGGEIHYYRPG